MSKKYVPKQLPMPGEIIDVGGKLIKHLSKEGELYAIEQRVSRKLFKSSDWGETWTILVENTGSNIQQALKMPSGKVLVALRNGSLILSDTNESNFQKVFEIDTPGDAHFAETFGFSEYNNLVFIGEYGPRVRRGYMSDNGGEEGSWREVFKHPDERIDHLHDIRFDPYENLIWVLTGDGGVKNTVYFSADFGRSWESMALDNSLRATMIIPLPECVLFGSDDYEDLSIYKHVRPPEGTQGTIVDPYRTWSPKKNWKGVTPWVTNAAVVYGGDSAAYFGALQFEPVELPASIYGTKNGEEFYPIWTYNKLPSVLPGKGFNSCGIMGVFGPDNEGNLAAALGTDIDGTFLHLIKVKAPDWIEL